MVNNSIIWVLIDERPGNRSQALGVAEALNLPYKVKNISYNFLVRLPNTLLGASMIGLDALSRKKLTPPWPQLIIAAGRRSAPVALSIKRKSGGYVRLVHIMRPGIKSHKFDLIAFPAHDNPLSGDNVMSIIGAPHGVSESVLTKAREKWMPELEKLPKPRIAVFVGGSTRRRKFTWAMAREFGERISDMAVSSGGSLMISTSSRTGAEVEALFNSIACPSRIFRWNDGEENPYLGFLACADAVVVSGDSVSMCSEACAVSVPVQIFAPPALITPKHARCHTTLYDAGYAAPFDGLLKSYTHTTLNASNSIAKTIKDRLINL